MRRHALKPLEPVSPPFATHASAKRHGQRGIRYRRLTCEPLEPRRLLTILVTSGGDSGPGSLREAIALANATAGPDEIRFSLAAGSVIEVETALPALSDSSGGTTIDGDVNADGLPDVVLHGAPANPNFHGLRLTSSGNLVRGLVVQHFVSGISIYGSGEPAEGNAVFGCYVGTNLAGTNNVGTANSGSGIWVGNNAHQTVIGGPGAHEGNLVSGNGQDGVSIQGSTAGQNVVQGNLIGTNASGDAALGNGQNGVGLGNSGNTIGGTASGAGNVISGNRWEGISISGSGNTIQGNLIGTNAAGNSALGNGWRGLYVSSSNNTIGGTVAGARNVISGNTQDGVSVAGSATTGNLIQGNFIGTNSNGDAAIANGGAGVGLWTSGTTIGGTASGAGNVISGNGLDGIFVSGNGNSIQGNFIGTNAAGNAALGNSRSGVYACNSDNTIGGSAAGQGNRIAFNHSAGVAVLGASVHVTISRNVIYGNLGADIDLGNNGFTPNDPGDEDTGPNGVLNYPELHREPGAAAGSLRIVGQACAGATIEFFQTDNLYGSGDARVYLDSATADTAGNFSCDVPVRQGGVTAAATDAAGNTSEFSPILPTCSGTVDAEYLLITNNALAASFQPLVDRRTSQGRPGQLVTVEWIASNYDGLRPDGASDLQTKIRNCAKDFYEHRGTRWVCLGGDETAVPVRMLSAGANENGPGDMYYGAMTGTWDSNANGVYADAGDQDIDLRPQVMVGRIPVRTAQQVQDYLAKVTTYEDADPEGYSRTLLLAGSWGAAYQTGTARAPDQQDHELISRSEQLLRSQYWHMVQPVGQMAQVDDFECTFTRWDTNQCGDYDLSYDHLMERLNSGYENVVLHGHANPSAWGGETANLDSYNAGLLTNATRPSIFIAVACSTAAFDLADPSLAEALLQNPHGGAVAYLGGVRAMDLWDTPYPMAIYERMLGDRPATLGEAAAWDSLGWAGQRVSDRFNVALLGDPALRLLPAPGGRHLEMLSPVNCEVVARDKPMLVRWNAGGTGFVAGDKVKLEYSADSGQTWQTIAGAEALPFDARSFSWDVSGLANGRHYRVRVTSLNDPAATNASKRDFRIADMGLLTVKMDPPGPYFDPYGNQVWYWIDGNCANYANYDYSVPIGDPVILTAPSMPGYNFLGWTDGQSTVLTHLRTCNLTFAGDITTVAAYQKAGAPRDYYVNDDTAENGDAPGNDENDGLSPQAPMRHIQALLDRYFDVGTIHVLPGVYEENVTVSGDHNHITLAGAGADLTIIDGNQAGPCLTLNGVQDAALRDMTVRNGKADWGGGIRCAGSQATIASVIATQNASTGDGAGIGVAFGSQVTVSNCTLRGNSSGHYGGGIHVWDSGINTFSGNTFEDNTALCGGAFFAGMADVVLDQNTIDDNDATSVGGAVYLQGARSAVLTGNTFRRNNAQGSGGAIYASNTAVTLSGSQIQDNLSGEWAGGAFFYACTVAISGNTILGNTGGNGIGGIHLTSNCTGTVTGNTIAENRGPAFAGGIDLWSSNVTIADNVFRGNSGQTGGVSVRGSSQVTLISDVFSANTASDYGGAVYSDSAASVLLEGCQLLGNAARVGGAAANFGQLTARNCAMVGNTATSGGALVNAAGTISVTNCTLAANVASVRAGVLWSYSWAITHWTNNIVWANAAPEAPVAFLHWKASMSIGFCDVENGQAGIVREAETVFDWQAGNIDANPLFLRNPSDGGDGWGVGNNDDYGDPHLQAASPCIDAGDPAGDYTGQKDLDGQPRVLGGRVDIGADEIGRVRGRFLFYNNSKFDGNNPAANAADDAAIAPDKQALLPGGGKAAFKNYTTFSRGINGVMIDVDPLPGVPFSATDFAFRCGNDDVPAGWAQAADPTTIAVRAGAGIGGSDRVTLVWADNTIPNGRWLQVTVLANDRTGLAANDVFYFGCAVGETGNSTADAKVNSQDVTLIRNNYSGFGTVGIGSVYDFNREGKVNSQDVTICRNCYSGFTPLRLITPPASAPGALGGAPLLAAEAHDAVLREDSDGWDVRLCFDLAWSREIARPQPRQKTSASGDFSSQAPRTRLFAEDAG